MIVFTFMENVDFKTLARRNLFREDTRIFLCNNSKYNFCLRNLTHMHTSIMFYTRPIASTW